MSDDIGVIARRAGATFTVRNFSRSLAGTIPVAECRRLAHLSSAVGTNVRGLNTAATLWCSAAVGGFSGAGHGAEAALLTLFVLAGNTFLRPFVNLINRIPISETATEATYQVRLTVDAEHRDAVRDLLADRLEAANYPLRDIDELERADDEVELVATLAATSVEAAELDEVTRQLEKAKGVIHATWTSSAAD